MHSTKGSNSPVVYIHMYSCVFFDGILCLPSHSQVGATVAHLEWIRNWLQIRLRQRHPDMKIYIPVYDISVATTRILTLFDSSFHEHLAFFSFGKLCTYRLLVKYSYLVIWVPVLWNFWNLTPKKYSSYRFWVSICIPNPTSRATMGLSCPRS